MTTESGMDPTLRSYIRIVRSRKWLIALFAFLGLAASLGYALNQPKQYSATAQLLVQATGSNAFGQAATVVTPTQVQTDLELVTSAPVQRKVQQRLGTGLAVSAAEVAQTNVISLTAVSSSPGRAAVIANTYARAFVRYQQAVALRNLTGAEGQLRDQIRSLTAQARTGPASVRAALLNQEAVLKQQLSQMQVSGTVNIGGVALVNPAVPPASPSSPKPAQDGLLGLAAGLIVGLGAAFLRDNLDDALSSKDAAEQLSGVPVLAMIPTLTAWKKGKKPLVVSVTQPASPAAEAYRSLRTSLQFMRQERELRTLLVTSPGPGDGKTSTAANLGVAFAEAGERVVVVSCDLRRPRIGRFFELGEQVGLTTVLLGERALAQSLRPVHGHETLWLLGAGRLPGNPAELLAGSAAREVFASLRAKFDLVLIDSPPVLPVTDAAVLSKYADGVLMVVAAGQTKRFDLRRAAERLAQVQAPMVGTVLNQVTRQTGYGYGYGYGNGYEYSYGPSDQDEPLANVPVQANGSGPIAEPNGSALHTLRTMSGDTHGQWRED